MSRRRTPLPTSVADCHQLILELHAELAQQVLYFARLAEELAARRRRSAASKEVSAADRRDASVSFEPASLRESDRRRVC